MSLPSTRPKELADQTQVVHWIAELTDQSPDTVLERLKQEFNEIGSNVKQAYAQAGLVPYVWSDGLERFYEETDAFVYELVLWNLNKLKRDIRRWFARYLGPGNGRRLLTIGDGLGLDSVYLSELGWNVTYYEVPGYTHSFAEKVFTDAKVAVTVCDNHKDIPLETFDVLVCLDVLEHVPAPSVYLKTLVDYIKPGGEFIVHAPFYMIHPSTPTHLQSNRRYTGSLALFKDQCLQLVDGEWAWNPLVFKKTDLAQPFSWKHFGLRVTGVLLSLGRYSFLPLSGVIPYRHRKRRWFER